MTTQRFDDGLPPPNGGIFSNPHDPVPRGTELSGKYIVERTLGQGGMGVVVAARHSRLGKRVAIKLLLPRVAGDQQIVARFEQEARAASIIENPHIAQVTDVDHTDSGVPYMVMEYVEGRDLKSILRSSSLEIETAVAYLLQTCDALAAVHKAGIVHRDLKPGNLMLVEKENEDPCIKVLDFGIAKVNEPEVKIFETRKGDMLGTAPYMSPEQFRGSVDHRTDIWALGVIAYEFVTSALPFGKTGHFQVMDAVLHNEPAPPSMLCRDLPAALELVILKCLRKDPNERFQSMAEVAEALREAMGLPPPVRVPMRSRSVTEPIELPPIAKGEETQKTVVDMSITSQPPPSPRPSRVKMVLAGGGALATSAAVVGLVMTLRSSDTKQAPVNASPAPRVSASAMHIPLPEATAVATNRTDAGTLGLEPNAAKITAVVPSAKSVSVIATSIAPLENRKVVPPAEPTATTTISVPETKPTATLKAPETPATTATKKPNPSLL